MRGPLFFHRLNRIPSVCFLPSWADTHALAANTRAVASITGTAGWEAICHGKPALVFGNARYRKLPGVIEWSDDLSYEKIVCTRVEHDALQQQTGALVSAAHRGVAAHQYAELVPDFDEVANLERFAQTLLDVIRGCERVSFVGRKSRQADVSDGPETLFEGFSPRTPPV